jgi:hypothetical protein
MNTSFPGLLFISSQSSYYVQLRTEAFVVQAVVVATIQEILTISGIYIYRKFWALDGYIGDENRLVLMLLFRVILVLYRLLLFIRKRPKRTSKVVIPVHDTESDLFRGKYFVIGRNSIFLNYLQIRNPSPER